VAGATIRFLDAVDIRGMRIPLDVLVISMTAFVSGVIVPSPTWAINASAKSSPRKIKKKCFIRVAYA